MWLTSQDPPRTSLLLTDDWNIREKKKYFRRFVGSLLPLHIRTQKYTRPLVRLERSLYTQAVRAPTRPATTTHQTQPRTSTLAKYDLLSRSAERISYAMAERSRSLKMLVKLPGKRHLRAANGIYADFNRALARAKCVTIKIPNNLLTQQFFFTSFSLNKQYIKKLNCCLMVPIRSSTFCIYIILN
jgi:hypothetical protein